MGIASICTILALLLSLNLQKRVHEVLAYDHKVFWEKIHEFLDQLIRHLYAYHVINEQSVGNKSTFISIVLLFMKTVFHCLLCDIHVLASIWKSDAIIPHLGVCPKNLSILIHTYPTYPRFIHIIG